MKKIFIPAILLLMLSACDDQISPALHSASPIIVIDAFVDTGNGDQTIHITQSQSYFDNTLPPGVTGASVEITNHDDSETYVFHENPTAPGDYIWSHNSGGAWVIGETYRLSVVIGDDQFSASSKLGRVPQIDSITFDKGDRPNDGDDFYRAQFWATDPAGPGDTYWIRTTKNGTLLNRPSEINLAYDAAFSKGSNFDGFTFIQPIRQGINPDDSNSGTNVSPFNPGDVVLVQIYSLTEASFDYLNQVAIETNRPGGFSELFAKPLANVSTNLVNSNTEGTLVAGFFNMASLSQYEKTFIK